MLDIIKPKRTRRLRTLVVETRPATIPQKIDRLAVGDATLYPKQGCLVGIRLKIEQL